ncbi:MAG: TRAP transporter large permease subunit, partial [Gammaproteobacteria bacterium]
MTTATLFIILFGCMLLGMPIALALGLSSITTILLFSNDSLASIALKLFESLSEHYTLLAIPFFILSSSFLSTGGVAKRLIRFAVDCVGHIRGGLAMASVMACMLFAAVSGSSPATVAAIGTIVIAGMVKSGYPEKYAAGVIANAGTLGILIPPSIVMLVYAAATEESAARMFMAGFIPGLMMGLMLMLAIYISARIIGLPSQKWPGFRALLTSGFSASGGLMLIVIVLGSIYGGI